MYLQAEVNVMITNLGFFSLVGKKLALKKCILIIFVNKYFRVARWYIFIPKMTTLVHFRGPWDGKFRWFSWPFGILLKFGVGILWPFCIWIDILVYFMANRYFIFVAILL
jgi:hypothetical protein